MAEEEGPFTFQHFIDAEALSARVSELDGKYTDEQVAATAFYLGVLSLSSVSQVFMLYGDTHYAMHLLTNIYAGEWLTTLIETGAINPVKLHEMVLREHPQLLDGRPDEPEDIKSENDDVVEPIAPMDRSTFDRLWGRSA